MVLLIDGYNLLHYCADRAVQGMSTKTSLIQNFNRYARYKGHERLTVIFDGGGSLLPERTCQKYITIVHTGYRMTADDYIIDVAVDCKGLEVVVITSDRDLSQRVEQHKAVPITVSEFLSRFLAAISQKNNDGHDGQEKKKQYTKSCNIVRYGDNNTDIDALMHMAACHPEKRCENSHSESSNEQMVTGSKKRKERLRILNKL